MLKIRITFGICLILKLAICSSPGFAREVTETRSSLGTFVSVTFEEVRGRSDQILELVFQETKRLERIFSTYRSDSIVSELNRDGFLRINSPELRFVIMRGLHYCRLSDGAFDITVKPLLDLYHKCYRIQNRAPNGVELTKTLSLVNYENVVVDQNRVHLTRPGMRVTLDGIAKGYIVDAIIRVLRAEGICNALVNIGGDLRGVGVTTAAKPWKIALQDPRDPEVYLALINLADRAVATSGDYERYFLPDKRAHHIIDPRTGLSATSLISVTVIAESAVDADALATAVFVMGPKKGLKLIESLNGIEGLLITRNREVLLSSGFHRLGTVTTGSQLSDQERQYHMEIQ